MAAYAVPALYAVVIWWFSTGLIILLDHRPRSTHPWSMAGGTLVLAGALWAIGTSAADTTEAGAYTAFTGALLVWGWQEMSYYMGFVSGPRTVACPPGARGFARFRAALATSLWHEVAIIAGGLAILWLTWGGPNRFALWTYLILAAMNLSARLNMFLGVRNLNAEFLPAHLAYLAGFLRNRAMNPLFPLSVAAAASGTLWLAAAALGEGIGAHELVGFTVVTTLMALATLEHGFLMLPLPSAALWQWSLPGKNAAPRAAPMGGGADYGAVATPPLTARSREAHETVG
ncbi:MULTISPECIES: putative photosynthetic complex assembly protein PuhE [unclassified Methylobacterium]|uniref:putative photosynthetic complex assembly protein PuhE n=1 Tax=unclassified Methylobacterium TaxID=2615210 RepID=UPI0009EBD23D|nr:MULTISPECIES: putative photosynthetic complex assembly protein PuhE [unclassified Methylobacterium]USU31287.1 putative photosynthetic complex assembly protein PuhE [Methylobacterium sp. OTU13CASTA1]